MKGGGEGDGSERAMRSESNIVGPEDGTLLAADTMNGARTPQSESERSRTHSAMFAMRRVSEIPPACEISG